MSSRTAFAPSTEVLERFSRKVSGRLYPLAARQAAVEPTELPADDLSYLIDREIRSRWRMAETETA
jgi:hypothetical protein